MARYKRNRAAGRKKIAQFIAVGILLLLLVLLAHSSKASPKPRSKRARFKSLSAGDVNKMKIAVAGTAEEHEEIPADDDDWTTVALDAEVLSKAAGQQEPGEDGLAFDQDAEDTFEVVDDDDGQARKLVESDADGDIDAAQQPVGNGGDPEGGGGSDDSQSSDATKEAAEQRQQQQQQEEQGPDHLVGEVGVEEGGDDGAMGSAAAADEDQEQAADKSDAK